MIAKRGFLLMARFPMDDMPLGLFDTYAEAFEYSRQPTERLLKLAEFGIEDTWQGSDTPRNELWPVLVVVEFCGNLPIKTVQVSEGVTST